MPVTVKVNGSSNSLVHKGSNGISTATIPDVCKTPTPGGPVPLPYPNISQSATLDKGTKTVKADGGMMIAIKGSEFSMSNGDEPGSIGGVKSNTFIKESTWILYSFDVKMDGENACRLSDKKFQNHENTADLAGVFQPPVMPSNWNPTHQKVADCLCGAFCDKLKQGFKKGPKGGYRKKGIFSKKKKKNWSKELEDELGGRKPPVKPPACLSGHKVKFTEHFTKTVKTIPDANLRNSKGKVTRCFDFKFPGDRSRGSQKMRQTKLADGNQVAIIDAKNCGC
jgi:hypothetical protein